MATTAAADWRAARLTFAAADADLRILLRDVAAAAGLSATIDDRIVGRVAYVAKNDALADVLSELGARQGFEWWYDGAALQITPATANVSRIIKFTDAKPADLRRALQSLGLYEPRFELRTAGGLAYLTAPPGYVAVVELVLGDLEAEARRAAGARSKVDSIRWGRRTSEQVGSGG